MKTYVLAIDNSRGVRIPKALLEESGLTDEIELTVKKGEIRLTAPKRLSDTVLLSESALMKDWGRTKEDEAWAFYDE